MKPEVIEPLLDIAVGQWITDGHSTWQWWGPSMGTKGCWKCEAPELEFIRVIGVDRKYHVAEAHKDTCKCGIKVLSKKHNDVYGDGMGKKTIYSCYECTF